MTTFQQTTLHDEMVRCNYAPITIRTYVHALRTCERYYRGRASISWGERRQVQQRAVAGAAP